MNKIYHILRKLHTKIFGVPSELDYSEIRDKETVNDMLYKTLSDDKPCMIARYGAVELSCILNFLSINDGRKGHILSFIKGESSYWWWNSGIKYCMNNNAGFFPPTEDNLIKFSRMMLSDSHEVDALAVFNSVRFGVNRMLEYLPNCKSFFTLSYIDPFLYTHPWSRVLKGKRVVVVHPFAELIERQYAKRDRLFDNPDVLPDFHLRTVKAVQSLGGETNGFKDWFEALEWMKHEIDKDDYDICLLGCGAYGFPLAAHVKRTGHKAVHVGGSLQLWFGIKGNRWDEKCAKDMWNMSGTIYNKLFSNPTWVRPDEYRTMHSEKVEGACYW